MLHLNQTLLAPGTLLTLNLLLPRSECPLPSPGQPRPSRALGLSPQPSGCSLWRCVCSLGHSFIHSFVDFPLLEPRPVLGSGTPGWTGIPPPSRSPCLGIETCREAYRMSLSPGSKCRREGPVLSWAGGGRQCGQGGGACKRGQWMALFR